MLRHRRRACVRLWCFALPVLLAGLGKFSVRCVLATSSWHVLHVCISKLDLTKWSLKVERAVFVCVCVCLQCFMWNVVYEKSAIPFYWTVIDSVLRNLNLCLLKPKKTNTLSCCNQQTYDAARHATWRMLLLQLITNCATKRKTVPSLWSWPGKGRQRNNTHHAQFNL